MINNLSLEEIKDSVEYQWRKSQIKTLLGVWIFVAVISLFLPIIYASRDLKLLGLGMSVWLVCLLCYGLLFGGGILFYFLKNRYLLKNYQKFQCYEVVLDRVSTSYMYTRSISYTVDIVDEGTVKAVDTNPYFSSSFFAKFDPDDYNNKKVIGLYDDERNKFYIVKKVK